MTARATSSGSGIPAGGTTGQVLKKNSNADSDAGWAADSTIPTGGTTGQSLTKNSGTDGDAGWSTVSPTTTKRVTHVIGCEGFSSITTTALDVTARYQILLPVTTTQWRIRVRNIRIPDAGGGHVGALFLNGAALGDVTTYTDTGNRWDGKFSTTPTTVLSSATMDSTGADWTSSWVTNPAHQFTAHQHRGLSCGFNSNGVAIGQWDYDLNRGLAWWNSGAAATFASTTPSGSFVRQTVMDVRLEYEFVSQDNRPTPVVVFVGDSITSGYVSTVNIGMHSHENWAGQAALRSNCAWTNLGVGGAMASEFATISEWRWARIDWTTTVPDKAVICLGSNDIFNGTTVAATVEGRIRTVIDNLRTKGIKEVYLAGIPPRNFSGASETARVAVNAWMASLPNGVSGYFPIEKAIQIQATPEQADADYIISGGGSPYTNPHPSVFGYQQMAAVVRL